MRKTFFTLLCAVCVLAASAQTRYLRINKLDNTVIKVAVSEIDSIDFVTEQELPDFNGHEYVDLGLPSGLLWATCNVGANSPEEYGDYFAWGEVTTKESYYWSTYKYCNGSSSTLTKYCNNSSYGYNGFTDNKTVLDPEDDAAHVNWGGDWRMPILTEIQELFDSDNCTWSWTTQNGVYGRKVTSKANGNSIFLPAAGFRAYSSLNYDGSDGYYWSSSLGAGTPGGAYGVCFYSGSYVWGIYDRSDGQSVRAVCSSK